MICFCAGRVPGLSCGGGQTYHHIIPKQRIKRRWRTLRAEYLRGGPRPWPLSKALNDRRDLIAVCLDCHMRLESGGRVRVEFDDLPKGFWDYAEEYGLNDLVPRHLSVR